MYKLTLIKDNMETNNCGLYRTLSEAMQTAERHAPEDVSILISPKTLEYHITVENARGGELFAVVVNDKQVENVLLEALWSSGYSSGTVINVELL